MKTGKVKFFKSKGADGKGNYGFIKDDDSDKEYFFHVSGLNGDEEPEKDDPVTFETRQGRKGEEAFNIDITD